MWYYVLGGVLGVSLALYQKCALKVEFTKQETGRTTRYEKGKGQWLFRRMVAP